MSVVNNLMLILKVGMLVAIENCRGLVRADKPGLTDAFIAGR